MEYDTTSEEVGDEDMEYVQTFFAQDEPYTSSSLRGPTPQHTGMSVVPANLLEDKEVDPDYDATLRHMYNENPQRDVERLIRKKID